MADDKNGREDQAANAERRQREREVEAALERGDEPEPPIEDADLDAVEEAVASVAFPATAADLVAAVGDQTVRAADRSYTVADLLPDATVETFTEPTEVRSRIERPTVARAMKRIVEACEDVQGESLDGSQWDAYERTFQELAAIDSVDENEGIPVIADWILERIHEKDSLPGSRDVRRRAAKYCRAHGYAVRNDEWLGV